MSGNAILFVRPPSKRGQRNGLTVKRAWRRAGRPLPLRAWALAELATEVDDLTEDEDLFIDAVFLWAKVKRLDPGRY